METACSEIAALGDVEERVIGVDVLGGPATLLETTLLERGERVRYIPGTAVNKVRDAYPGGEHKSDPKDAFVIADQLNLAGEVSTGGSHTQRKRNRTQDTGRLPQGSGPRSAPARLPPPGPAFPGVPHARSRAAGSRRKGRSAHGGQGRPSLECPQAGQIPARTVAESQGSGSRKLWPRRLSPPPKPSLRELPASEVKAALVSEIAWEILRTKDRIADLEKRLEELVETNPDGKIVGSLPGMGLISDGRVPGRGG